MVSLRWIDGETARKISESITVEYLKEEILKLESEMNAIRISFDEWTDADQDMLVKIIEFTKLAAKNNTGIIYAGCSF